MIKNVKQNKTWYLSFIVLLLAAVLVILPYFILPFYTNPSADDFSGLNGVLSSKGTNWLTRSFYHTKHIYQTTNGAYISMFLWDAGTYFFQRFGMAGLRTELFFVVLFFFVSLFLLIEAAAAKCCGGGQKDQYYAQIILVIFLILTLGILKDLDISEVFLWHSGACPYTIPLSFAFCSVAFYYRFENSKWGLAAAAVCAFIAGGGNLMVNILLLEIWSGICVYEMTVSKKRSSIPVLAAAVISTGIVIIAPGNYVRRAIFTEEYHIADAVLRSAKMVSQSIGEHINGGMLLMLSAALLFIMQHLKETIKIQFKHPVFVSLYSVAVMLLADFPFCFGVGVESVLPARCRAVESIAIYFWMTVITGYSIGWAVQNKGIRFDYYHLTIFLAVWLSAVSEWALPNSWSEHLPFKIYEDLGKGDVQKYAETNESILSRIQSSEESNAVIEIEAYDTLGYMKNMRITHDPESWTNAAAAEYYKKESVMVRIVQKQ